MSVGENIRKLREEKGLTQLQLSNVIGISRPMIAQIERGSKALNIQLAKQIADFFSCSIDDLIKE